MARIRTELVINAPAARVWALVTDWPAQSRWIPLTTVTIDRSGSEGVTGLGARFTGRTRLGPLGFDDPMEVTEWRPATDGVAGRCRVRKLGPWLTGWAEIEVRPSPGGTRVEWVEEVRARWTPRIADPVIAAVGSAFFGRVLRKMAAELALTSPE
ncbi:SRPBCC family protein [Jatrophihabitans sp.]|uniref:SRPBCC family protein n=1 Tax=Jatrophihabitans sp. TaxID=1932789 RepID=UPI002F0F94CA